MRTGTASRCPDRRSTGIGCARVARCGCSCRTCRRTSAHVDARAAWRRDARLGPAMIGGQIGLFGHDAPTIDEAFRELRHVELAEGAWYDYAPGWLAGHSTMFESL